MSNYLPMNVIAHVLPPFKPTEYLFEKNRARFKGEDWKVQGWAVREIMSRYTGVPTTDQP